MTDLEKGIAIHERLAALMQEDGVPMSDAWAELFDRCKKLSEASQPIAFTETCEITNMQATGLYLRGFPTADQGRNIPLFVEPQHNPALVSFPRCTFRRVDELRVEVYRGELLIGLIYNACDGWFISLPEHRIGDVPPFRSLEQAMSKVIDTLDRPA
ncbi:hypothetical protein ECML606-1_000094 [Escherichia phage ECML-606-1]|nr:hypothetical protein ECML606-1_000094 [Escherichia phage ECML-606-1]